MLHEVVTDKIRKYIENTFAIDSDINFEPSFVRAKQLAEDFLDVAENICVMKEVFTPSVLKILQYLMITNEKINESFFRLDEELKTIVVPPKAVRIRDAIAKMTIDTIILQSKKRST